MIRTIGRKYHVKPGEGYLEIGAKLGRDPQAIARDNGYKALNAGMAIEITPPFPTYYPRPIYRRNYGKERRK
jgi:hypothetical protein